MQMTVQNVKRKYLQTKNSTFISPQQHAQKLPALLTF
jgi:hypothetical protein